jgi:hypothetical protein
MESEKGSENDKMAPPSIKVAGYRVALEILAFIVASILIFRGTEIAQSLNTTANLPQLGLFLMVLAFLLFILGRLRTD